MPAIARCCAVAVTLAAGFAFAQPMAPTFSPANLTPSGVRSLAANCAACHGTDGQPAEGSPLAGLAGRSRDQLLAALVDFRDGRRPATVMHQIARGYSDEELAALADHFSAHKR